MARGRRKRWGRDVVHRWEGNPMIVQEDLHFSCLDLQNAAAAKVGSEYVLLLRVEDMQGRSVFVTARSSDGEHFDVAEHPVMVPSQEGAFKKFETRGVEDPRITFLDDTYYIIYTASSSYGTRLALAKTNDFETIERIALISEPDNKNGALFPSKINGDYARVERPREGGCIWLSYSDDLIHWGRSRVLLAPRGSGYWDTNRVGCAAPPIEIDEGWLLLYYGVRQTASGPIFRLGAVVLDRDVPERVLKRTNVPILSPREMYERVGDVCNIVFSCGAILEDDGEIKIYYGAANTAICLGTVALSKILERCYPGGGINW